MPTVEGSKPTRTSQVPLGARTLPVLQSVPALLSSTNWPAPLPVMVTFEIVAGPSPVFETTEVMDPVAPSSMSLPPKDRSWSRTRTGCVPVPLRSMVAGAARPPSSGMVSCPVLSPVVDGSKVTSTVQLSPGPSDVVSAHVPAPGFHPKPAPLAPNVSMPKVLGPEFVNVNVSLTAPAPMLTSPKSKLGVLGDNVVNAPVPLRETLAGSPPDVSTGSVPERGPTADGTNTTWTTHDWFGARVVALLQSVSCKSTPKSALSVELAAMDTGVALVFVMVTTWAGEASRVSTVPNERLVGAAVIVDGDSASASAAVINPAASTARPSSPQRLSRLAKSSVPFDGRVRWAPAVLESGPLPTLRAILCQRNHQSGDLFPPLSGFRLGCASGRGPEWRARAPHGGVRRHRQCDRTGAARARRGACDHRSAGRRARVAEGRAGRPGRRARGRSGRALGRRGATGPGWHGRRAGGKRRAAGQRRPRQLHPRSDRPRSRREPARADAAHARAA